MDCVGAYDIPILRPYSLMPPLWWQPMNDLSRRITPETGISLYVDDYRLQRLWRNPQKYVGFLSQAGAVLSPDFSLYADAPAAMNLYNHYRKHWLGAWWQAQGIRVIPSVSWADPSSFAWCFDGEPEGSVVSVSSVGTQRRADQRRAFLRGYDAMMERLRPDIVLFFGIVPGQCRGNIQPVEAYYETVARRAKKE